MTAMRRADGSPRVAVTGLGVKSPAGNTPEEAFATVLSGKSQATHIPELMDAGLPVTFGCPLAPFDPAAYLDHRERRQQDRTTQIGVAAAGDAVKDAGEGFAQDKNRCGVFVGTAGANLASQVALGGHEHHGTLQNVPVTTVPRIMTNATAAWISVRHGYRGPCLTISAACASGTTALGEAALAVRYGRIDAAVAGGVDTLLTPFVIAAFARMGALSRRNEAPAEASRPFDADRDGFVMGEGAAFLTLERLEDAIERGATVYGEIAGYAAAADAGHIVLPLQDGTVAAECMRAAIDDAGMAPDDVGHVNAHGTATDFNDRAEAAAIERCFGPAVPPVTASKGVSGHLVGAGGAFEAVIALLSAREGLVPPVANFTGGPDADRIDVVHGGPRTIGAAPVLSNSFGFGGHNASLLLTPSP